MNIERFKTILLLAVLMLFMVPQSAWASYRAVATKGKLPGAFSVSATKQVWFSQGNLQYQADNGDRGSTWRFAIKQYDFVGDATHGNVYEKDVKTGGLMVQGASAWNGSGSSGDPYLIASPADWETFATSTNAYSETFFKLTADITVTTMRTKTFSGTFDGGGHTLTFNYTATGDNAAPFAYITGATIKNLRVAGTITTSKQFAAGIVAISNGGSIENCRSSVTIDSSTSGDGTHGGLVADSYQGRLDINNCLFDGKLLGKNTTNCGGIVGWHKQGTLNITNTLFAPAEVTVQVQGGAIFARNGATSLNHCYYISDWSAATVQGTNANSMTAEALVAALNNGTKNWCIYRGNAIPIMVNLVISTKAQWDNFSSHAGNYENKYVQLNADISNITAMTSGTFQGIFDGNGHTLTVNLTNSGGNVAPFYYLDGGTIMNLTVSGGVTTAGSFNAGLVARTHGGINYIQNCIIHTNVAVGDYGGGVVGHADDASSLTISDCIYDGTITHTGSYAGGFIGWYNRDNHTLDLTMTNCLCKGTYNGNGTFHPIGVKKSGYSIDTSKCHDCYYTTNPHNNPGSNRYVYAGTKCCKLTIGTTGVSIASGSYATFQGTKYYYGTITLGYNGPMATTNFSLDGTHLNDNSFTISKDNAAFDDGTATIKWDFPGRGTEGDPYQISSAAVWDFLADQVAAGNTYSGKYFRQTADIGTEQEPITRMVGIYSGTESSRRPFSGTFDGQGHTLTVDYSGNDYETRTAPFSFASCAAIKNLIVTGNCGTAGRAAGIVGESDGSTTTIVTNCVSSVTISGGLVGGIGLGGNVDIRGCLFNGTINGESQSGGLVGWGVNTTKITNCLFAPQAGSSINGCTFYYTGSDNGGATITNSYYTTALGTAQGKQARSITAGTYVTIHDLGGGTEYDVSGITAYAHGIKYDDVYYAGNGDKVNLTLSHDEVLTGFSFGQYAVTGGGTLTNPATNIPMLTMTDANQTINVEWTGVSQTFNYTGDVQTFTVPATGYYTLECYGAQGGYSSSGLGGKGGLSQLTYPLTQGDVLYIYVGGQGGCIDGGSSHPTGGDGGWNGGGKGGTGVAWGGGNGDPYNGGGGGGGATHIATSAIGPITGSTNFTDNHTGLVLLAGGGGGGLSLGPSAGGAGGGAEGGNGHRGNDQWSIAWNNGALSCGRDGMTSSNGGGSCEGCGGGGAGYVGGNTWTVTYNASNQSYSGAGGSSWGETTNGINYSTTSGGATEGGNGKAVITLLLQGSGTSEDPYLISSVDTWNNLADQVNAGTTYSGKYFRMTKDISVTTMVGNSTDNSFRGTFDGNGHTLNISYNTTSDYTAPFRYIQGATFKNLKVTGNITTTMNLAAGIAGLNTGSPATFEQCATDVTINSSSTTIVGWGRVDYHGGLLARTNSADVNITDCVCGGSVNGSNGPSSTSYCAGFVGVAVSCTVTGTRCLNTTSYTNVSITNSLCHTAEATRSVDVFYYVNGNDGACPGTQVTVSDLQNSSYATDLQDGRPTTVWVQYLRTNQPMLKQFTKYTVTYHANGGSGSVPAAQDKQQGDDLMLSNSTLTLSGFAQTGWNTNSDGTGTHYDLGGTYSSDADVTLYAEWDFQGKGTEEEPYLIPSTEVWNYLADQVNGGTNYSGKYFQQTGDFTVSSKIIGYPTDDTHYVTFNGIYDGNGHTITASISKSDERYVAPFHCIANATIKNVIVTGSVTVSGSASIEHRRHPAGLVGVTDGTCIIQNCRVSANVSGCDYMGGLIGHTQAANITITGCVYSGTLTASGTEYTGGFIGWGGDNGGNNYALSNNLFAGLYSGSGKFHPVGFLYNPGGNTRTVTNTYYTAGLQNVGDNDDKSLVKGLVNKGKFAYSITGGTGVTVSNAGTPTTYYNVSDITSYGIGIKYGEVLYGGNGDAVSLNLGYTPQSGYSFHSFTASAGTLTGSSNPYTLTMTNNDATISARYSAAISIAATTTNAKDGWYLIASPMGTVSPSSVTNLLSNNYDLFRFNQGAEMEWQNYMIHSNDLENPFNALVSGQGYLYANSSNVTLTFIGTPYSGTGEFALEYSTSNPDTRMRGWNLIGNPFGVTATIENPFYRMNNAHNEIISAVDNNVAPMEGVFVHATAENQTVTFSTGAKRETDGTEDRIVINLNDNKGTIIDRAIVSFEKGRTLPKFQIRDNSTKLYIPKDGVDYAIAFAYRIGELPLNFKAQETGVYTLNFNGDNMTAVSLVDMIEGAIIDLSVNDTYTFIGTSADRADRFKLVFSSPNDSNIDIFAYQTGNDIVVSGEGELQVFDVMGRMVMQQRIDGVQTVAKPLQTGVYIFRLNEKSQKIVVR